MGFVDERLQVLDVAVSVGVLEQDGRDVFVDVGDSVEIDDGHFEAHGFGARLDAGDRLRVQSVRYQERFPLVDSIGQIITKSIFI